MMSFTNLTTKTEIVKSLQHFALNVKMYKKCDIDAKCCKFLKTYFALFVISNERYYYKKESSSSFMSFTSKTTKTELIKSL